MPRRQHHRIAIPLASYIASLFVAVALYGDVPEANSVVPNENRWWEGPAVTPVLVEPEWVSFDLNAIIMEALRHNPRIAAVTHEASVATERIVQENAIFDPALLLSSKYNSLSDPVGNNLTTGGPPRLNQDSWDNKLGIVKTNRDGTKVDLSQQTGLLNSNSVFFSPSNQGNARLSLSVTRPLRAGSGLAYNQRLIVQARIGSNVSIQTMREEVQNKLAQTMVTYWQLYQSRCQLVQQQELLNRGIEIEQIVTARRDFDSGELEMSKVQTRIAKRRDQLLVVERELRNIQTQLVGLVGSDVLRPGQPLELIPVGAPSCVAIELDANDAIVTALQNRTGVRTAALDLESAALEVSVTRNELMPQLNAVVGGYLAGLNGNNDFTRSFGDQFASGRPGINGGLEYEAPYARRAAKSRNRAAYQRYLAMSERYREAIYLTRVEIETASRNLATAFSQLSTKRQIWEAAIRQEKLIRERWESLGPEGRHAALTLEDLLDQQERRTEAEADVVASEVNYLLAFIELQQVMGTLLTAEGIDANLSEGATASWIVGQGNESEPAVEVISEDPSSTGDPLMPEPKEHEPLSDSMIESELP